MARRRRRNKGFFASLTTLVLFGLAAFGGYTLYQQNEKEAKSITKKTVKATKSLVQTAADKAKKLADKIEVPMAVGAEVWVCWFKPEKKALKECQAKGTCSGSGVYSQHPNREESIKLGADKCAKEFGTCEFEYCERGNNGK